MIELLKLFAVLGAIFALLRARLNLGLVMLAACALLALLWLLPPAAFLSTALRTVCDPTTLKLLLVLWMVSILEKLFKQSGLLGRMIGFIERAVRSRRLRLIVMPAFLGLLPSPGGAMFSAPFVQRIGEPLGLSGEEKTFVNFWFRHVWEYVLPLYPGTILATTLLGVPFAAFFPYLWPYTLAALAGGVLFGLLPMKLGAGAAQPAEEREGTWRDLCAGLLPVVLILCLVLALKWDLTVSFALVLALQGLVSGIPARKLPALVFSSLSLQIVVLVLGVLFFKDLLAATGATARIAQFLTTAGVPPLALYLAVPLVMGLLTGITQAYVAIAFPLLLGTAHLPADLPLFGFAFLWGFTGVMLSPLHLCLVLTSEYFKTDLLKVYRYLALPLLLLGALSFVMLRR